MHSSRTMDSKECCIHIFDIQINDINETQYFITNYILLKCPVIDCDELHKVAIMHHILVVIRHVPEFSLMYRYITRCRSRRTATNCWPIMELTAVVRFLHHTCQRLKWHGTSTVKVMYPKHSWRSLLMRPRRNVFLKHLGSGSRIVPEVLQM